MKFGQSYLRYESKIVISALGIATVVFVYSSFQCPPLPLWVSTTTLVGLVLDVAGALLIVAGDLNRFSETLIGEEEAEEVEILERSRNQLVRHRSSRDLTENETEAMDKLLRGRTMDIEDYPPTDKIYYRRAPPRSGVNLQYSEPNADQDNKITYGRGIVDNWVEQRITELERRSHERIRRRGAALLATGFGLQLIAAALGNFSPLRQLVTPTFFC
jgi:hypothetical protein